MGGLVIVTWGLQRTGIRMRDSEGQEYLIREHLIKWWVWELNGELAQERTQAGQRGAYWLRVSPMPPNPAPIRAVPNCHSLPRLSPVVTDIPGLAPPAGSTLFLWMLPLAETAVSLPPLSLK